MINNSFSQHHHATALAISEIGRRTSLSPAISSCFRSCISLNKTKSLRQPLEGESSYEYGALDEISQSDLTSTLSYSITTQLSRDISRDVWSSLAVFILPFLWGWPTLFEPLRKGVFSGRVASWFLGWGWPRLLVFPDPQPSRKWLAPSYLMMWYETINLFIITI